MRFALDRGDWIFRQFDSGDDVTSYRFRFVRWVTVGDRTDIAEVELLDEWKDWQGERVTRAIFAARHAGVDLRGLRLGDLPAHVHLMTAPASAFETGQFAPAELSRTAWATIEPVGVQLNPRPEVQVATIRLDPSAGR